MNFRQIGSGLSARAKTFGKNVKTFVNTYRPNVTGLKLSGHRLANAMLYKGNTKAYINTLRNDRAYANRMLTQAKVGGMMFVNNIKQIPGLMAKGVNFIVHKSQIPKIAKILGMGIDFLKGTGKMIQYRGKYYRTISKGENILFKINSGLNLVTDTIYGINDADYTMRTKLSGRRVKIRGNTSISRKMHYKAGRAAVKGAIVAGTTSLINYGIKGLMSGDSRQEN